MDFALRWCVWDRMWADVKERGLWRFCLLRKQIMHQRFLIDYPPEKDTTPHTRLTFESTFAASHWDRHVPICLLFVLITAGISKFHMMGYRFITSTLTFTFKFIGVYSAVICSGADQVKKVCFFFQGGLPGGHHPTATAVARATRASVKGRAATLSTSSPLPVLRPSQRRAPLKERWSVAPWPGAPTSRPWIAQCTKALVICCSMQRCAVRLTCSVWEPLEFGNERLQRGKQTRRKWLLSRSCRNASRTSAALGFQIAFQRGSTCGNRSSWENIVSKDEWNT